MNLNLKPKSECKYDAVSLGEVMLRLDPGRGEESGLPELFVRGKVAENTM